MAPAGEDGEREDAPVLSPEDLDIAADEHVRELDDGRYLVSPAVVGTESIPDATAPTGRQDSAGSGEGATEALDAETARAWIGEDLAGGEARYGVEATAAFDDRVSHQRLVSNDIVTVFESMLLWYARQVDADTPVEEVLGILLAESSVPLQYPARSLHALVESVDVEETDSVADLLAAVDRRDGVQR